MTKQELEQLYLGRKVHVIIRDPYHPVDAIGFVDMIDDACQIHGTWGGLAVVLPEDSIELVHNYKVEITETLQRVVEVEASSAHDALEKVKDQYRNEEVVLDSTDFIGNDFQVLGTK